MKLDVRTVAVALAVSSVAFGSIACSKDKTEDSARATASAAPATPPPPAPAAEPAPAPKEEPKGDVWSGGFGMTDPWAEKELSVQKTALTIQAPSKAEVRDVMGTVEVSNDMGYTLWISELKKGKTLDAAKKEIEKSSATNFKGWVTEESDVAVFKSEDITGQPIQRFISAIKVDDKTYRCELATSVSIKEKELIDQMVKGCRSLKKKG
jgi:hypothetical protein